ncbi:Hypothetical Protein FCC1311_083442 [Hondaea fermentalgiana]|uniref:ApaG domain-containing protein n=1 Tax=Hondaea fermentalgiana TaxID=2315210 RepID=A0A2R5GP87_9STRA|nr:Hypothetical Protein FCC1311_083442 [Hondaea fermentalgiana]|eukprot:GBG32119.1 Hypothetical Protein FCC1311_083442 [Hondaea fermentalgiana]
MEAFAQLVAVFPDGRDVAALASCSRALATELSEDVAASMWAEMVTEHFGLSGAGTSWRRVVQLPCEGQAYTREAKGPKEAYLVMRASMMWAGLSFKEYRNSIIPAGLAWQRLYDVGLTAPENESGRRLGLQPGCGKFCQKLRRFGRAGVDAYGLWAFHDGQTCEGTLPLFGECGAYEYMESFYFSDSPKDEDKPLELLQRKLSISSRQGSAMTLGSYVGNETSGWSWSDRTERASQASAVEMFTAFADAVASKKLVLGKNHQLLRFPMQGEDTVTTEAHGIRIQISVVEMVCLDLPKWGYQIKIEANEQLPRDQLILFRRRWEIKMGDGEVQVVEGDGVVGRQPILLRGGGFVDERYGRIKEGAFAYTSFVGPQGSREAPAGSFRGELYFNGGVSVPVGPITLRLRDAFRLDAS